MVDVIVVGGSYAGLAAAMQLARARREVLVVDSGQRRNRFTAHAHGFIGFDGESPAVIAAKAKADVLRYSTVRWIDGTVTDARAVEGGFALRVGGEEHASKRLVLATGIVDDLPQIPGLRERWGKTVFPCPYCDGYERDRGKLGVMAGGAVAAHYAPLVAEWGQPGGTTLFLSDDEPADLGAIESRGIHVERDRVAEARDAKDGVEIVVAGGRRYELSGVFMAPRTHLPGDFARTLGCEVDVVPTGSIYRTDPTTKETSVRGVFACGDAALGQQSVSFAVGDGARAGISVHRSLVFPS